MMGQSHTMMRTPTNASILYYPAIFHTELAAEDVVWDPYDSFHKKGPIKDAIAGISQDWRRGFVRFNFALPKDQLFRLKQDLSNREGYDAGKNCVQLSCKILTDNTSVSIPFPFNLHPTLNALYFAASYYTGVGPVRSMEVHGDLKPALQDLVTGVPVLTLGAVFAAQQLLVSPETELYRCLSYLDFFLLGLVFQGLGFQFLRHHTHYFRSYFR